MYLLALAVPRVRDFRLPLSRDQLMLVLAASNLIFLGVDIYLAHLESGTIVANEWIPIVFGPAAGLIVLFAGLLALRYRDLASVVVTLVFLASIGVGLAGIYFHLVRAALPSGPEGEQLTVRLLVWGPPILGPSMFALIGLWGMSAAWREEPPDSGNLRMVGRLHLPLPLSKTRAYLLMVSLACLATVISAVFDHARTGFENPWLWIPTVAGVFGTLVAFTLGVLPDPRGPDVWIYLAAMAVMVLTGVIGLFLHIGADLTVAGAFREERFLRNAPVLAPLLYADVGLFGAFALLDPRSEAQLERRAVRAPAGESVALPSP